MREYTTPRTARAAEVSNLTDPLVRRARNEPDSVALSIHADGIWTDVSVAAFLREVKSMAKGLVAAGVEPGDRVVLMSSTRYEWTLTDYAIWYAGAVSVPPSR